MREKNGSRGGGGGQFDRKRKETWTRIDNSKHGQSRRSRSRSPIKSKLMALAMQQPSGSRSKGLIERDRDRDRGDKSRRDSSRDQSSATTGNQRRMRMDELDGGQRVNNAPSPVRRPDDSRKKNNLDKVVKKAREERTNYWDKKILEVEDKDPDRWGHSGYQELYHQRRSSPGSPRRYNNVNRRSMSRSPRNKPLHQRQNSPPRFKRQNQSPSRSLSRSRSPIRKPQIKSRKDSRKSFSPALDFHNKASKDVKGRIAPKNLKVTDSVGTRPNLKPLSKPNRIKDLPKPSTGIKSRLGQKPVNTGRGRRSSFSSSGSSISRSRSFSPSPLKKTAALSKVSAGKRKDVPIRKRSPSYTDSSSSSSSDEDVLQIHAKRKSGSGKSPSLSYSSRSSSTSSGIGNRLAAKAHHISSSSSFSGSSSDDSDSDESVRTKPKNIPNTLIKKIVATPKKTPLKPGSTSAVLQKKTSPSVSTAKKPITAMVKKPNTAVVKKPITALPLKKTVNPVDSGANLKSVAVKKPLQSNNESATVVKQASANEKKSIINKSGAKVSTVPGVKKVNSNKDKTTTTASKEKVTKSASESGETESGSDSSSESDSEPRMTLSERFAKLAQMSTDKREMAKPILSVNEIDTKMRVVKDFRNPEAPKVYVTGQGVPQIERPKPRPKTPEYFNEEKRLGPDDQRRRHFERMYQDEPVERPLDWSDPRVRYKYYKDRGCFDERPITFDEYIKWEDWYNKYREWLEHEGYYDRGGAPPPGPNHGGGGWQQYGQGDGRMQRANHPPQGRRIERINGPLGLTLSSRSNFGRPENNEYLHASIGRRIDRTPGGSLVVNIRQGGNNNFGLGGRGRRLGGMPRSR